MSLGRKLQSAAPTVHRILAVEQHNPDMTAIFTEQPLTGRHLSGRS
jgi:hypothetical protein